MQKGIWEGGSTKRGSGTVPDLLFVGPHKFLIFFKLLTTVIHPIWREFSEAEFKFERENVNEGDDFLIIVPIFAMNVARRRSGLFRSTIGAPPKATRGRAAAPPIKEADPATIPRQSAPGGITIGGKFVICVFK